MRARRRRCSGRRRTFFWMTPSRRTGWSPPDRPRRARLRRVLRRTGSGPAAPRAHRRTGRGRHQGAAFDEDFDASMIPAEIGVSPRTLCRALAQQGITPAKWIWQKRLDAARDMLVARRGMSVSEVAITCGFSDFSFTSAGRSNDDSRSRPAPSSRNSGAFVLTSQGTGLRMGRRARRRAGSCAMSRPA